MRGSKKGHDHARWWKAKKAKVEQKHFQNSKSLVCINFPKEKKNLVPTLEKRWNVCPRDSYFQDQF